MEHTQISPVFMFAALAIGLGLILNGTASRNGPVRCILGILLVALATFLTIAFNSQRSLL